MLVVLTGPVRSGKSRQGLALAIASGRAVVLAAGGQPDDEEMRRRIERHQAGRSADVTVIETAGDPCWYDRVPDEACLLVDCMGTVLGVQLAALVTDDVEVTDALTEERADALADAVVSWLIAREAPTVVVTNEVGWGVVPATPLGRLFRDVLGRANRTLVDAADAAWLVIEGRSIPLHELTQEVSWPREP
ncbi:MAG: bifunctional adenosylcobinamide kinase/adenosylcobinamide-phosphate guanylyltransferase [Coriobacteriia bacterium]|nr:bifunctional adenosylcobinamide kinase/adenosylcobinamide-phosphate guanylyltransferase [Coriobacteriia bacterium]